MFRKACFVIVFIGLAACGVKPGTVQPPEGAEQSGFPRTYPDIQTDPGQPRPVR
jgi:hypothetical protein